MRFLKLNYVKIIYFICYACAMSIGAYFLLYIVDKSSYPISIYFYLVGAAVLFLFLLTRACLNFFTSDKVLIKIKRIGLFDNDKCYKIFTKGELWDVLNNDRLYGYVDGFPISIYLYEELSSKSGPAKININVFVTNGPINTVERLSINRYPFEMPEDLESKTKVFINSLKDKGFEKGVFPEEIADAMLA